MEAQQSIQPEVAYLITSMLQSVIDEGTAASAKGKLKRPAAGNERHDLVQLRAEIEALPDA